MARKGPIKLKQKDKQVIIDVLQGKSSWSRLSRELEVARQGGYTVVATLFKELVMSGKIKNINKIIK